MENLEKNTLQGKPLINPAVTPLFRHEAVAFFNTRQYGTVILTSHVNQKILPMFFIAITVVIIFFLYFFNVARKTEVSGVLLPSQGLLRIRAGQTGIVTGVKASEGQYVQVGDVLFTLSNERYTGAMQSAESTVSALLENRLDSYRDELFQMSRQSGQRVAAAQKRVVALLEEGKRLDAQIALQRSRIMLAIQSFRRFENLHATNYISVAQLEQKDGELLDQRQRLAELERLKGVNGRDHVAADAEYHDLVLQAQRDKTALKRNELTIQQDLTESEARREIHVVAPVAGTVTAIAAEIGKPVSPDTTLASLLPAGSELEAEIYAPSSSVGFVKSGMKVLLRYQAYPYQKFGQQEAIVHEVARTSMSVQELTLPGAAKTVNQSSEPVYRIRLKLKQQTVLAYGKPAELKAGMLLDASIILEHRRLYEWVLEPLFSISGRR